MSRAIAAVLRDAAKLPVIECMLDCNIPRTADGNNAYYFAHKMRGDGHFFDLSNEERSAFLYLCSLMAEDEE